MNVLLHKWTLATPGRIVVADDPGPVRVLSLTPGGGPAYLRGAQRLAGLDGMGGGMSGTPSGIEAEVCEDIAERQRRGISKYGTTVAGNTLSRKQWLQHAYEEAMDLAVYLKKLIKEESK